MKAYLDLLQDILDHGQDKADRTGTGTRSVFGRNMRFNLQAGFPLLTTKRVYFKGVVAELLWFLEGSTNAERLNELGAKIWDEWAIDWDFILEHLIDKHDLRSNPSAVKILLSDDVIKFGAVKIPEGWRSTDVVRGGASIAEHRHPDYAQITCSRLKLYQHITEEEVNELRERMGDLGPIYGRQWRAWDRGFSTNEILELVQEYSNQPQMIYGALLNRLHDRVRGIDQISEAVKLLLTKPDSRRNLVTAWNPSVLPDESVSPQENVLKGRASLPACHTFFQLYTEVIPLKERLEHVDNDDQIIKDLLGDIDSLDVEEEQTVHQILNKLKVPERRLSLSFYQR